MPGRALLAYEHLSPKGKRRVRKLLEGKKLSMQESTLLALGIEGLLD